MSSRIHHTELSQRDHLGIALGWVSLALLAVGLIGYLGNNTLVLWVKIVLGLGVEAGAGYLAIRGKAAKAAIFNPSTGAGINTTALTLIVLAILVMVNYIAGRHKYQVDLTRQHLYTLSPQTKEVVKNLKDEVQITAIYQLAGRRGAEGQRARDLLKQYKDISPKIKFEMLDPVAEPAKAMAKGVQTMDVIWVESGGRKETVYTVGEQEISSAILKVTRPEKKKVYFLFGHGERDIESYERDGLSDAKSLLEKLNYETSKLILQTVKEIPADCSVLVVAGPKNGLPANEQKMLAKYLENGGKMLLMLDPKSPVPTELVSPWGVEVGNNIVIDPRLGPGQALVEKFEFHQITKDLQIALFPLARSVSPATTSPDGVTVLSLAKTPSMAWAETKLEGPYQQDGDDLPGPVSLAVVAQKEQFADSPNQADDKKKSTRLIVVGNSTFATNAAFQAVNLSDAEFFLNSVNWLAEEEALVNIPPKEPERNTITLMDSTSRWIFLTTVLIVPFGVLLSGVFIWWRRR
ncbi:MAG: GldG family protein [Armatimonadetes bacterium]|nr:GldG family protein [Armatimonadota bacterium]